MSCLCVTVNMNSASCCWPKSKLQQEAQTFQTIGHCGLFNILQPIKTPCFVSPAHPYSRANQTCASHCVCCPLMARVCVWFLRVVLSVLIMQGKRDGESAPQLKKRNASKNPKAHIIQSHKPFSNHALGLLLCLIYMLLSDDTGPTGQAPFVQKNLL